MQKFMIFCLAFICCFGLFNSGVFAAEIPSLSPENMDSPYDMHVTIRDNDHDTVIFSDADGSVHGVAIVNTYGDKDIKYKVISDDNELIIHSYEYNTYYQNFKYNASTGKWSSANTMNSIDMDKSKAVSYSCDSFVSSSLDVYSTSDEVVFPLPPQVNPTLEEAITEGVNNLQAETVGTMGTLTIIAVGLLALLVGFLILPKVLYRFL